MRGYIAKTQIPILETEVAMVIGDLTLPFTSTANLSCPTQMGSRRSRRQIAGYARILRDYVLILANTGMRHGTEAQNLTLKHISTFEQDGRSYVAMWVKGKTKEPRTHRTT